MHNDSDVPRRSQITIEVPKNIRKIMNTDNKERYSISASDIVNKPSVLDIKCPYCGHLIPKKDIFVIYNVISINKILSCKCTVCGNIFER